MLAEDKQLLWRFSATTLGMALPFVMVGRGVMFALIAVGILTGLAATKGESLRVTVRLMLQSWMLLAIVALLLVTLLSAAIGINVDMAFHKWMEIVAVVFGSGLLFFTLREMPGQYVEILMKALAISAFAMMGLAVLDALLGDARLSAALHGTKKSLTPYRLNSFSAALSVLLPYIWARLMIKSREGEPFAQRVVFPGILFTIFTLVLCGGRAGWVGAFVAGVLFIWLLAAHHRVVLHGREWLAGLAALATGVVAYGFANGWQFMAERITVLHEGGRGPMSGRLEVWQAAISHLGNDIWLGIGLQNYRFLNGAVDMHPHNWLIQMLLETGLIGTAIFFAVLGMIGWRFYQFSRNNIYGVAALSSLAAFLVTGLANTSIVNVWWLTFFAFTSILGWRVAWGGPDVATRRRKRLLPRRALVPTGARKK
ncbi:MAG TPA: O-antigen ligase family protein [Alphaproteobacteria bacterium]|nr:O-antigen ligase family protein [Alphaproteobacteria bacterium]